MASPRIAFHPGAAVDYENAYRWYWERSHKVAVDFEHEVERALRLIAEAPGRWPKFDENRRRMIVRKFPYSVIYEVHEGRATVLAVAHGRRRPYYWRRRAARK